MISDYHKFLAHKAIVDAPTGIANPKGISKALFPFQQAVVKWGLQRGRAAFFEGTGLGKTPQQAEWARIVEEETKLPVFILAPLAVAHQTIEESKRILGLDIVYAEHPYDIKERGVYITNYQKLDRFDGINFGGVALDESSIIKSQDGKTKAKLLERFSDTPFRLACTATPAPNDYMELGNHAEFLGVMKSTEMLSTFFVHDGGETQKWRLKGHAEKDFWKWMASWAVCITHPRNLGFEQDGYDLPELRIHEVIVDCDSKPLEGELFASEAKTLDERRGARRQSINERVEACGKIVSESSDEQWLTWCGLNLEAEACAKLTESENVTGSDSDERKESVMLGFAKGEIPRITSKVSICGFGMNFQRCHKMAFVGLNDSFEGMFQAIRRCWRFGQTHPVDVYIILSSMEGEVLKNIKRKEADAVAMQKALVEHMAILTRKQFGKAATRTTLEYNPMKKLTLPAFIR